MDVERSRLDPRKVLYPLVDLESIDGHLSDWVREYRTHAGLRVEYPDGYDPILIRPDGREVDTWRQDYPYDSLLKRAEYDPTKRSLQIELLKLQTWAKNTGARIVVVFEGRDAAGKGSTIKRFIQHLNPRGVRVVALNRPNRQERTAWYFQRYVAHLPSAGEIVLFDRSWYNRATVEPVMGYCTPEEHRLFLRQAPLFEHMLAEEGIILVKFWFSVSRAEQLTRFVIRDVDPVRRWKLSEHDLASLDRWDAYTAAKEEMFGATHTAWAPWTVVNGNGKRLARIEAMRFVLSQLAYEGRSEELVGRADPLIVGPPILARAHAGVTDGSVAAAVADAATDAEIGDDSGFGIDSGLRIDSGLGIGDDPVTGTDGNLAAVAQQPSSAAQS